MAQAMLSVENNRKLIRRDALGVNELLTLFKYQQTVSEIPFRPAGGDLFIFRAEDPLKRNDWKADGHTWSNQGSKKPLPRAAPKYLKTYFYIKTKEGKADKGFRKEVYFPIHEPESVCIVQYDSLSKYAPHGNSKKSKPFFPTKPSVLKQLQEKPDIEKSHKIYKDLVCENTEGHPAVSKPRNVKQIHNVRAAKQHEVHLTRDAIYNSHEIAYEGGFVQYMSTFPDLCVVVGDSEMIVELNEIVKLKDPSFLMSYDTTFSLGDFYVSPLVFKNTMFEGNPLVAAMFLVHERKLQETHDVFFRKFAGLVKNLKGLPIVTDMESAIVRAIREQTNLTQIGCWRHLRQDVQRWLSDNFPRIHRSKYVNDLYEILRTKTKLDCDQVLQDKTLFWENGFTKYFERNVEPKLEYFCIWSIHGKCPYDPDNGITTNQSEGFNFLLKDFQNWKEVPLDCLLMSLKLIQGFYLEECRRGKAGLGNYTLKDKYLGNAIPTEKFESRHLVCHPKDIVSSIKNKEFVESSPEEHKPSIHASNTRELRAKELVHQDSISFSSKLGTFTINDSRSVYVVKLYPSESCTCPVKKGCIHILAVKIGLRMALQPQDFVFQNLAVVRKTCETLQD